MINCINNCIYHIHLKMELTCFLSINLQRYSSPRIVQILEQIVRTMLEGFMVTEAPGTETVPRPPSRRQRCVIC